MPTSSFSTLQAAFTSASVGSGQSCLVDEPDGALAGQIAIASLFPAAAITHIDAAAGFVVGASDNGVGDVELKVVRRDGAGTLATITPTAAGTLLSVVRVLTDGIDVVLVYAVTVGAALTVESFNVATGASNWIATPMNGLGAGVRDVAWDQTHVYLVGTDPGRELIALIRSTGLAGYTYNHSGPGVARLDAVASNGHMVFVGGAASAHPSGATLRGIIALTGADDAGEGGLGANALAWDVAQLTPTTDSKTIATDGKALYVGEGAGVQQRSVADGVARGTTFGVGVIATVRGIAVDQDYVYVNDSATGGAFLKSTKAQAWTLTLPVSGFARAMSADGTAVFFDRARIARGNYGPIRFKRIDPAVAPFVAIRNSLTPTDIA